MGMRPGAVLGYGIVLDEEQCYEIKQQWSEEEGEEWGHDIGEFIYGIEGLDCTNLGSYEFDNYIVFPDGYGYIVTGWGDTTLEIGALRTPENTKALDDFCDKYNIEKNYKWT